MRRARGACPRATSSADSRPRLVKRRTSSERERLTAAQRLLARGRSVTDVCLDIGFNSLGSFSALFARRVGVSPARYQRSLRRSVYIPDWTPHPPSCLLWIAGPEAIAIFEKTVRRA